MLLLLPLCAMAQDKSYAPNTNWPYVNADFADGVIYLSNGTYSKARLNIHLHNNVLQCVTSQGTVNPVTFRNISYLTIGANRYSYAGEELMEELSSDTLATDGGQPAVLKVMRICRPDFPAMFNDNTAYYMDMNTSAMQYIQKLNLRGESNEQYSELRKVWYDGREIPTKVSFYLVFADGSNCRATRTDCMAALPKEQRKMLKTYLKQHSIDWHDLTSLQLLLHYMNSLMTQ